LLVFAALLASLPGDVAREFVSRNRHEERITAASAKTLLCRLATEARTQKQGVRPLLEQFLSLPAIPVLTRPRLDKPFVEQPRALESTSNPLLFQRPPPSLSFA
jgi:hypothetical protein